LRIESQFSLQKICSIEVNSPIFSDDFEKKPLKTVKFWLI